MYEDSTHIFPTMPVRVRPRAPHRNLSFFSRITVFSCHVSALFPYRLRPVYCCSRWFGKKSKGKRFVGIKKLCTFAKHYKDYPLLWDRVSKNKGVSALTEMPFFNRNRAAGVLSYLPKTFYETQNLYNETERSFSHRFEPVLWVRGS